MVQKEEFIMPSNPSTSTMSNVSTDLADFINQSLDALVKRIDKSTRDFAIRVNNQLQDSSKGRGVDHSYSTEILNPSSSAASASISQPFYSMPPNYFAGQSPPPRSALPNMAEPVGSVLPTGQTGVTVASPTTPTPFASIHCSAAPSRTNELANFDSSYTIVACSVPSIFPRGSGVHHGPIPNDVHNDLLRRAPVSSVQTMSQIDSITHCLTSNAQASTSRNYKADLVEDLANTQVEALGQECRFKWAKETC